MYSMRNGLIGSPMKPSRSSVRSGAPENGWDFAERLICHFVSADWTWHKTGQLILLLATGLGGLTCVIHVAQHSLLFAGAAVSAVSAAGAGAGATAAYRRHRTRVLERVIAEK
jgi:hypothetical protein